MRYRGLIIAALVILFGTVIYRTGERNAPVRPLTKYQVLETPDPRLQIGSDAPNVVNLMVQIQEGTQSRYVLRDGVLTLDDAPFYPLNFPGDYGELPQTLGRGGDPLGVIILTTDPTPPGTLLQVKPIALIIADEGKLVRSTILAVPVSDIRYRDVEEIADLEQEDKDAVINFIQNYRTLQGRPAVSVATEKSAVAKSIITMSVRAYQRMNVEVDQ